MSKPPLTVSILREEANLFAEIESVFPEPTLYGVTDGKAIGTYLEQKFRAYLATKYSFVAGNSALGIDFPDIEVDMKVTSINQPQSSCPFKSARQKIFGLGYSLIVFVYEKTDDQLTQTGRLVIRHVIFIEKYRTADYQMTRVLRETLANGGNEDDLVAVLEDRMLPIDTTGAVRIAQEILTAGRVEQGYLTISNALQWRLQYGRVIAGAGQVDGVVRIR